MRPFFILTVICAVIGALAGVYAPRTSEATIYHFQLLVHPGASQTLNCGWHDGHCPNNPSAGHALDWANSAQYQINWRSFGWRSFSGSGVIARGTIKGVREECWKVKVEVRSSIPSGVIQGVISYTHSDTSMSGTTFDINGSSSYQWTARAVGYTRETDEPGCMTAHHLHQTDSVTGWSRNSAKYPTANECQPGWEGCDNPHPIYTFGYHQTSHGWYYEF
ncbi:MAG: hypothetical protein ACUVV3_10180 [Dehalococcoidia bacterium]